MHFQKNWTPSHIVLGNAFPCDIHHLLSGKSLSWSALWYVTLAFHVGLPRGPGRRLESRTRVKTLGIPFPPNKHWLHPHPTAHCSWPQCFWDRLPRFWLPLSLAPRRVILSPPFFSPAREEVAVSTEDTPLGRLTVPCLSPQLFLCNYSL